MSTEPAWGELDVLHPLLVRAVQCSESLMTQLQKARDQAAIAGLAVRLIGIPTVQATQRSTATSASVQLGSDMARI